MKLLLLTVMLNISVSVSSEVFEVSGDKVSSRKISSTSTIRTGRERISLRSNNAKIIIHENSEVIITIKDNLTGVEIRKGSIIADTEKQTYVFRTSSMSFSPNNNSKSYFKINQPLDRNPSLILFEGKGQAISNTSIIGEYSFYDDFLKVSSSARLNVHPYDVILGSGLSINRFDNISRRQLGDVKNNVRLSRVYEKEEFVLSEDYGEVVRADSLKLRGNANKDFGVERVAEENESTWTKRYFAIPSTTIKMASYTEKKAWSNFQQLSLSLDGGIDYSKENKSYGFTVGMSNHSLAYFDCKYCTYKTPQTSTTNQFSIYYGQTYWEKFITQYYLENTTVPYLGLKGVPSSFGANYIGVSSGLMFGRGLPIFIGGDFSIASTELDKGIRGSVEAKMRFDFKFDPRISLKVTIEKYGEKYISSGGRLGLDLSFD